MNRPVLTSVVLYLMGAGVILGSYDTRIEETPIEVVELRAERSIVEVGGDPSDWIIEGSCVAMGPCSATAFAARFPDRQLAESGHTVKQSRAVSKASDAIGVAAARAAERGCFDQILNSEKLEACISGS